jgi:Neuraminidase (sialidase)
MHMDHATKSGGTQGITSLDVYADGQSIHVLTGLRLPHQPPQLQYTRSDDGGEHWTTPVRVDENKPAPYDRLGMDPQIAAFGNHLIAVWTTRTANEYGRGPLATALSSDGGKTWQFGPNPADDHSTADHGMIDIAADAAGAFHLVWLDARTGQKGLQYARSTDNGRSWSSNQTLDPATCECCWNTLALNSDGKIAVLYRSLSPRDMAVVLSPDGGAHWQKPAVVGSFGWKINACPHAGGGLAFSTCANRNRCHAVVWTGQPPAGVYALSSTDGGRQWLAPHCLGDDTARHPTLAASGNSATIVAAWEAQQDGRTGIFVAQSTDDGETWSKPPRISDPAASANYPRMIWTPKGFRVFWVQQTGDQPTNWKSESVGP